MSCTFNIAAYYKIVLHALKFPENSVCGLITGSNVEANCVVMDSFPVCHYAPTGPIFDIAADMVCFLSVYFSLSY